MITKAKPVVSGRLLLQADTAGGLMTSNPLSIRADAGIAEAISFLTDKGFSAAPVIDVAGRPVGVLSRADVLVHCREQDRARPDLASVGDVMTPAVYCVPRSCGLPDRPGLLLRRRGRLHRLIAEGRILLRDVSAESPLFAQFLRPPPGDAPRPGRDGPGRSRP